MHLSCILMTTLKVEKHILKMDNQSTKTGTCVIFESMKHFHGVNPANVDGTGEDRYTSPIWYTSQPEEMELQSHGNTRYNKDGGWRDLIRNPDPETVNQTSQCRYIKILIGTQKNIIHLVV